MRASDFIGAAVVDRDGRQLGRVSDLILDEPLPVTICYALVDMTHAPDAGQRTVAVPWSLLRPERAGQPLTLGVSRDALQRLRAVKPA
jgi:sporulation protein YlmC with PRC-barrel domain